MKLITTTSALATITDSDTVRLDLRLLSTCTHRYDFSDMEEVVDHACELRGVDRTRISLAVRERSQVQAAILMRRYR